MNAIFRAVGRTVSLGFLIGLSIFMTINETQATPLASVSYVETWDSSQSEWDYEYHVENNSDGGELLYDFFLDMWGLGANLSNVSDPVDWEHFTDDSTFIEWSSIPFTISEIVPGGSLDLLFSSDIQLGGLYYGALFEGFNIVNGTSIAAVPEPATWLLLGSSILCLFVLRRNKKFGALCNCG